MAKYFLNTNNTYEIRACNILWVCTSTLLLALGVSYFDIEISIRDSQPRQAIGAMIGLVGRARVVEPYKVEGGKEAQGARSLGATEPTLAETALADFKRTGCTTKKTLLFVSVARLLAVQPSALAPTHPCGQIRRRGFRRQLASALPRASPRSPAGRKAGVKFGAESPGASARSPGRSGGEHKGCHPTLALR